MFIVKFWCVVSGDEKPYVRKSLAYSVVLEVEGVEMLF